MPEETLSYNILDKPCIYAILQDKTVHHFNLIECIEHAHEIVAFPYSHLEEYSLIRILLMPLIYRCLSVKDHKDIQDIFNNGEFDIQPFKKYFDEWHDRFDLFHPDRPLFQKKIIGLHELQEEKIIEFEKKRNKNKIFEEDVRKPVFHLQYVGEETKRFGHSYDVKKVSPIPADNILLPLICHLVFSSGCGPNKKIIFIDGKKVSSWSSRSILCKNSNKVFWIKGDTLFHSVLYNIIPCDFDKDQIRAMNDYFTFKNLRNSRPTWEYDELPEPLTGPDDFNDGFGGILDYYTCLPKYIELLPEKDEEGNIGVRHIYYYAGHNSYSYKDQNGDKVYKMVLDTTRFRDPFCAYHKKKNVKEITAVPVEANKMLWRYFVDYLFASETQANTNVFPPEIMKLILHERKSLLKNKENFILVGCGLQFKSGHPTVVEYIDNSFLSISEKVLEDKNVRDYIQELIKYCEIICNNKTDKEIYSFCEKLNIENLKTRDGIKTQFQHRFWALQDIRIKKYLKDPPATINISDNENEKEKKEIQKEADSLFFDIFKEIYNKKDFFKQYVDFKNNRGKKNGNKKS